MTNGSKYRQVEQYIIKEIEKGNLKTGDQIMTEEWDSAAPEENPSRTICPGA